MRPPGSLLVILSLGIFVTSTTFAQDLDEVDSQESRLPHYLRDDGIKRVAKLGKSSFEKALKHSKMLVLLFYLSSKDHPESEKAWKSDEQMLEVVARILQPQGVTVASINIAEEYELAQQLGVKHAGAISIFHRGKKVEYYGHRSADVLVTFLHKMFDPPVTIIETKTQRKLFDGVDGSKVIAYFDQENSPIKQYEEAAKSYQPLIPFFMVTDKKIAKSLRLKKPGTILLHKPFEKPLSYPSSQTVTEKNLYNFVQNNRKQIIAKIRLEDIHETWSSTRVEGYLVIAFVKPKTTEGAKFFQLVRNLAKGFKDHPKLTFVWVDPEPFPMMRDYWQKSYRIDVNEPALGVVDPKMNKSSWFKAKVKEPKLRHLQQWMKDVLDKKVEFLAASTEADQATESMPTKQEL